jgi:hypothetical protein
MFFNMCLFLLKFSVHESILDVQGCKSHPVLVDARRIYRFHKQGKDIFIVLFKVLLSMLASKVWRNVWSFSMSWCAAFIHFNQEREDRFRKRVKHYTGIWCCVTDHTPGHIYYDMYWDEKPGWKPIPPQTSADDHPPWWCQLQNYVCHQNAMIAGDTVINRKYLKVVYFPTYCEYLSFEGASVTDTCGYIQPFYFLNLLLVSMSCQVSIFVSVLQCFIRSLFMLRMLVTNLRDNTMWL